MVQIRELIAKLKQDVWRLKFGFSEDVHACSTELLRNNLSQEAKIDALRTWLAGEQPCVFGRIAAGPPDLISFCLLDENDLSNSDSDIQDKIQASRDDWKMQASSGEKSAFIILALSKPILEAAPDENLQDLALRLLSLYLVEEQSIVPDQIYQDEVFLYDYPDRRSGKTFKVGANFFGSQGDKRWWHDHRIPGGIGFSMNSPGHMARAGEQRVRLLAAAHVASREAGEPSKKVAVRAMKAEMEKLRKNNVTSLQNVLKFAMLTIRDASEQLDSNAGPCWDKATRLLRKPNDMSCPMEGITSDPKLRAFDFSTYLGWYHTDHTIPTDYFVAPQEGARPTMLSPFALDFSYIYDSSERDYREMSSGVEAKIQVRAKGGRSPRRAKK
jgi:hypothetical protein